MAEPRFLLVRLEADLAPHRVSGIRHAIMQHPGVLCIFAADLTGLPADCIALLTATAPPVQGELPLVELSA